MEGPVKLPKTELHFFFNIQVACEATQSSINNADLGLRAIRGMGEMLAETGNKGTFAVIPSDLRAHIAFYRELKSQGHEIGLHIHPAEEGYDEFLGVYSFEEQRQIIGSAVDQFADCMGIRPLNFTGGYGSANDHTYPVLESMGLKHGQVSIPTRDLPQCACVWGSSPLDAHYPHRYHRCLAGDVDFVDIPPTMDPSSRLWGGAHPQDLRVELVDAKNHWYTIQKSVKRQIDAGDSIPVKYIKTQTHNVFDFSDRSNFRRETLAGIIRATREICARQGAEIVPATTEEIAARYRQAVPLPDRPSPLKLDTRARSFLTSA